MRLLINKGEWRALQRRRKKLSQTQQGDHNAEWQSTISIQESDDAPHGWLSVTHSEACWVIRRRLGYRQRKVASEMGISRQTLHNWEVAGDDRLLEWLLDHLDGKMEWMA